MHALIHTVPTISIGGSHFHQYKHLRHHAKRHNKTNLLLIYLDTQ